MEWVKNYQLFLFDFDGLLVDTEHLHYKAYLSMCRARGFDLPWSFQDFANIAHFSATGLKENLYAVLPLLQEQESDWSLLYKEKQALYQ
ncbi:MAG: HAD hydrolase-like protein, partial [Chlamydiota bacterium]